MKTREVMNLTGLTYAQVYHAVAAGKIPAPVKDCSGDYRWSEDDVQRLREAVAVDHRRTPRQRVA